MKRKNILEKKTLIGLLLIVAILIVLGFTKFPSVLTGKTVSDNQEENIYQAYQQTCSKGNDYFAELCGLVSSNIGECVKDMRKKSSHCDNSEIANITEQEFDIMDCECIEWEKISCPEGFELIGRLCYKGDSYTRILKSCSTYMCKDDYFVEIYDPEKAKKESPIKVYRA